MAGILRPRYVVPVVLAVVLWALVAAWLLLGVRDDLSQGRDRLAAVTDGATPSSLLTDDTAVAVDGARADFDRARTGLRSPVLSPLRVAPVVGRHLRALDRVAATGRGVTEVAADAVSELRGLADRPLPGGSERVAVLRDLVALTDRAGADLAALDPGSPDALVGPVADGVERLAEEVGDARRSLDRTGRATTLVADLLDGPTPYLLLGANNAEMRAGSGMFLSAAPLDFDAGRLQLGEVRPTETLVLPAGSVTVDGDLADNWPWIDVGRDLRSLGLSADFPQSAAVAVRTWAQVEGGSEVGGVVAVDVDAVRGLLEVVGPVEVDGVTYDVDTARGELLRAQYARFGDDAEERRDQLGEVARAVFERIEAGEWELDELATTLVDLVARRHLLVWSADPATQEAWEIAGVDGGLGADSLSVAMLNRGAQKLDAYLRTEAELTSTTGGDGRSAVTVTYRIANEAPETGPRYQIGPNIAGLEPGEHRGIVVVNLPAGTTDIEVAGTEPILRGGDGETVVVAGAVALPPGGATEVTVRARLAAGVETVTIEPSARIPRTVWTVDGRTFETDRRRTVPVGE